MQLKVKKIKSGNVYGLPPAGVNVPNPLNPVVVDDAGAPNDEPNPVVCFCPNKPPKDKTFVKICIGKNFLNK